MKNCLPLHESIFCAGQTRLIMQAKFHLSYASDLHRLLETLLYIEAGKDLFGWYGLLRNQGLDASYYMIENFYTDEETIVYRSHEDDLYGQWQMESGHGNELVRNPLSEAMRHELEHLQSRFIHDWLFFDGDPLAQNECMDYTSHHLPLYAANIHLKKLARMSSSDRIWEHHSAGFDENVLEFLHKHRTLRHPVSPGAAN